MRDEKKEVDLLLLFGFFCWLVCCMTIFILHSKALCPASHCESHGLDRRLKNLVIVCCRICIRIYMCWFLFMLSPLPFKVCRHPNDDRSKKSKIYRITETKHYNNRWMWIYWIQEMYKSLFLDLKEGKTLEIGNDDSNRVLVQSIRTEVEMVFFLSSCALFSYGFAPFLFSILFVYFAILCWRLFLRFYLHSSTDRKCHRRFSVCAFVFIPYSIFAKFLDGFAGEVNLDWNKYKVMPYCTLNRVRCDDVGSGTLKFFSSFGSFFIWICFIHTRFSFMYLKFWIILKMQISIS